MIVYTDRFDYLGKSAARQLGNKVRDRRRKALDSVRDIRIRAMTPGGTLQELLFDHPPTLGELTERLGTDVYVVSVQKRRREGRVGAPRPMTLTAE